MSEAYVFVFTGAEAQYNSLAHAWLVNCSLLTYICVWNPDLQEIVVIISKTCTYYIINLHVLGIVLSAFQYIISVIPHNTPELYAIVE